MPEVADARELLNASEVTEIRFHEVSARRVETAPDDDRVNIEVLVREDENEIGVRCRVSVLAHGGDYVADAEAVFQVASEVTVPPEVLQSFVERVGIMVAYPYARTAITDGAAKLALPRPTLKLLRAEDVKLQKSEADDENG